MRKQFAIIGCGRFGSAMGRRLYALGHEVLMADVNEERINNIADEVTHALIVDVTDEDAMAELEIANFDAVVVAIGDNLQASVMAVVLAKEAGAKYVIAKATDDLHAKILEKVGADSVVLPERDMGRRMAQKLISNNVLDFIELSNDYGFTDMKVPEKWVGKNLRNIDLRAKYGANVVAICDAEGKMTISPPADMPLDRNTRLIIIAPTGVMEKLDNSLG